MDLFLVGHANCIIYNIIHLFGGNGSDLDVPVKIHTILSNKVHVAELQIRNDRESSGLAFLIA